MNLDALQSAFDADPAGADYHQLVTSYVSAGRMADALIVAQQVVQYRPQDVAARRLMGWVMLTQSQIRPAMQAFSDALQQNPSDSESRFLYGLCLERLEELDQARVQLGYVLQSVPNHAGALEALKRLDAGEQPPPPREDKTVMMSLDDVVSSKTYTGSSPNLDLEDEVDETPPGEGASTVEPAQTVDAQQRRTAQKPIAQVTATQAVSVAPETASPSAEQPEPETSQDQDLGRVPVFIETDTGPQGSPLVTGALAILVAALLLSLHHFYGAWAKEEKSIADNFNQAERAFIADGAGQLRKAATLAQMVVQEKPENDKARGLAAHALARLEIEYGIPQQIMAAKKLFEGIETPLNSLHGRAAEAMILRAEGKYPEAVSALDYTTRDGRKINVPMFRRERALNLADQDKNKAALDELNKALENGGTRRDLLLTMAHFQLHRGTANAAFSYASRVLASVDQLHQEIKSGQQSLVNADQAEASAKTAIPSLEKELKDLQGVIEGKKKGVTEKQKKSIKALQARLDALKRLDRDRPKLRERLTRNIKKAEAAVPKLEVAPALILRAASLAMRESPALVSAMNDLKRALLLSDCDQADLPPERACISSNHRHQALAIQAALARRIGDEKTATEAEKKGAIPGGISLLIEARTAMDEGRYKDAETLAEKAAAAETQSALPVMLRLELDTRRQNPGRDDEKFEALLKTFPALKARTQLMAIERSSRAKDLADAQSRIQAYRKAFPSQTRYARYIEGRAYYFAEKYPEALKIFEETLEQAVRQGNMALGHRVMVSMMRTYGKMRRVAPMRELLKDILKDNPKQAEALYIAASLLKDRKAEKTLIESLPANRWTLSLKAR